MKNEGGCHCSNIAYRAEVDPNTVGICYCTDCQTLAGSAYRANIPAPADSFVLLRGEPKNYTKTAESGARRAHAFCGNCGMPIYAAAALALFLIAGCTPAGQGVSSGAWLLLVPPIAPDGSADASQPLYKWQDVGNFGTQIDCNASLQRQQFVVNGAFGPVTNASGLGPSPQALQILKGQCVARDDPRLANYADP